ncbi:MAG: GAF domain-containing protein [Chloroflexota bacterium]|nr:GAF domain-containing protein [Chloroflexota bacterium]
MRNSMRRPKTSTSPPEQSTGMGTVEETTRKIYTLNAIAAALSRETSLDRILEHALDWVLTVAGAESGTVFLYDEDSGGLHLAASRGLSERFLAEHTRIGYGARLSGAVLQSGAPLIVENIAGDVRVHPSALSEGIQSYIGVPLRSDNQVVGVLNVLSHAMRSFDRAVAELLSSIGNQIGVAVAKAGLRSAETASREQLHQQMNQLSALLKVSATFRANAPLEQVLGAICSAISSALGYRLVELSLLDTETDLMIPTGWAGFTPEERRRLRAIRRQPGFYDVVMQPRFRISNSYFISHRDNPETELGTQWAFLPNIDDSTRSEDEWHQKDALAVPLQDRDGKLIGMIYVDDPADRRLPSVEQVQVLELFAQQAAMAAENATLLGDLQKSEAKYRLLTETASDMIFLLEPDGAFGFVSSSTEAILGYEPAALLGVAFSKLLSPATAHTAPPYLVNPEGAHEREGRYEAELVRADGGLAVVEIDSAPVFENGRFRGEQGIARDISEKKRMEREIARRQRQLRRSQKREEQLSSYTATVLAAQEDERKRIARDLHDDTAQALIALSRRIEALREHLHTSPETAEPMIDDLKELTDQTIASVRRFSRDLRPSLLDDLGLVPALEWLVAENARRHKITTRMKVHGQERRLPSEVELTCFRIAQEALNNTAKHAGATGAAVELYFGPNGCRLSVSDNGRGFQPGAVGPDLAHAGRMGVMGMHERAGLLGGTLTVRGTPGEGTKVTATIPIGDG